MRFDLAALERFFGLGALSATKQHRLNVNRSWSAERYVAGKGPALERYQVVERRALYGQQHRLNVIRSWSAERYVAGEGPALERYIKLWSAERHIDHGYIRGQRQSAILFRSAKAFVRAGLLSMRVHAWHIALSASRRSTLLGTHLVCNINKLPLAFAYARSSSVFVTV